MPTSPSTHAHAELDELINELAQTRKIRGNLTQRQLAETLGLATNSVQDWELHRDIPTLPHLINWTRQLGLRLEIDTPRALTPPELSSAPTTSEPQDLARLTATLRAVRRQHKLLQQDLADHLNVDRSAVVRWEARRHHPHPLTLIMWARALDCRLRLSNA